MIVVADAVVSPDLWHYRLSHISKKGVKMLYFDGKLEGSKAVDHNLCEGCIFGKLKRLAFLK